MKRILIALLFLTLSQVFYAAHLKNVPQELKQPDGTVLNCFATGDEFFHWLHDAQGYTIIKNPTSGFFVYADLQDDKLVPTGAIPNRDLPSSAGLSPNLNISSTKVAEIRRSKYQIPKLKGFKGTTNTGTLNNIVIFIRFADQSEYTAPISSYNTAFNGTGQVSVYEYYKEVSDDQLEIKTQFFPGSGSTVVSYQDAQPRSYYEEYDATSNTNGYSTDVESRTREHTLLKNATESVTAAIEATGKDFDMDNDGYVDNIAYIIQGATDGWSDLLWPHMWALYSFDVRISGLQVWYYNFQLSDAFGVSVLCHEMFHTLGAPDLYRYTNDDITPVGPWDIMAANRNPPQHMSAYMKLTYGDWFSSIPEITSDGTYTLEPLATNPFAAYVISSPNSSEYFVVEYRKSEGRFESSVPGSGLIVYRIDPSLRGNADGPPDEIYVYRPDGTTSEDGSLGSAHFSSSVGRTEINDATNPSSFLSDGSAGGLNISNISTAGATISFDVSFQTIGYNAPRNLTATAGIDLVDLAWDAPDSGAPTLTGFNILKFGTLIATLNNPSADSYQDPDLSPGLYSYSVSANYESPTGTSDPSNTASAEILELKPDLTILGLALSPTNTNAGSSVNASMNVKNRGILVSPASELVIYLSTNNQIDNDDIELETIDIPSLDPAAIFSVDSDYIVPEDLTTGEYYIIAYVDYNALIDEVDETNNEAFRILGVRATFPDLQINRVSISDNEALPGQSITIEGNWTNIGNRTASSCDLLVAFSDDQYFDGNDIAQEIFSSPVLTPGETYNFSESYELPSGVDIGTYYIIFWIDGNDDVQESNESNNEDYARISLIASEDIGLSNMILAPDQVKDGSSIDISFDIKNSGINEIPSINIDLVFAHQNSFSNNDQIRKLINISNLGAGEKRTVSSNLLIPAGTVEDTYYLHAFCDPQQTPDDSNVDNNHVFRQVGVLNYVDLDVALFIEKEEYKPGESAILKVQISNLETKLVDESELTILVSDNTTADFDDTLIEGNTVNNLSGNSMQEIHVEYMIPFDSRPGLYYIIGIADLNNLVSETNEQNNLAFASYKVLDTSSDNSIPLSTQWNIYPNPSQDWIRLNYHGTISYDPVIRILNTLGQEVYKQSVTLDNLENQRIDISNLTPGLYYIQIIQNEHVWNSIITVIR